MRFSPSLFFLRFDFTIFFSNLFSKSKFSDITKLRFSLLFYLVKTNFSKRRTILELPKNSPLLKSNEKAQNPNVNVKDGSGGMLTYLLNSAAVVWTVDLDKAIGQKTASC